MLHLQERRQLRLFVRPDTYGRFSSCLVFLSRDRYNADLRLRMQEILPDAAGGEMVDYGPGQRVRPSAVTARIPASATHATVVDRHRDLG